MGWLNRWTERAARALGTPPRRPAEPDLPRLPVELILVLQDVQLCRVWLDTTTLMAWRYTDPGEQDVTAEAAALMETVPPLITHPPVDFDVPAHQRPARLPFVLTDTGEEYLVRRERARRKREEKRRG